MSRERAGAEGCAPHMQESRSRPETDVAVRADLAPLRGRALVDAIRRVEPRLLLRAVRRIDPSDLTELRSTWALWAQSRSFASLPAAWAAFVQAGGGRVEFRASRCRQCGGRRFSAASVPRNLARTGHAVVCGECRGTGQGQLVRHAADPVLAVR